MKKLSKIDWKRDNPEWNGRAIIGERISKSGTQVELTAILIKKKLGMGLTDSEKRMDESVSRGRK